MIQGPMYGHQCHMPPLLQWKFVRGMPEENPGVAQYFVTVFDGILVVEEVREGH